MENSTVLVKDEKYAYSLLLAVYQEKSATYRQLLSNFCAILRSFFESSNKTLRL